MVSTNRELTLAVFSWHIVVNFFILCLNILYIRMYANTTNIRYKNSLGLIMYKIIPPLMVMRISKNITTRILLRKFFISPKSLTLDITSPVDFVL